jgi:hypothetical protein
MMSTRLIEQIAISTVCHLGQKVQSKSSLEECPCGANARLEYHEHFFFEVRTTDCPDSDSETRDLAGHILVPMIDRALLQMDSA